jgi:hypothetical protein
VAQGAAAEIFDSVEVNLTASGIAIFPAGQETRVAPLILGDGSSRQIQLSNETVYKMLSSDASVNSSLKADGNADSRLARFVCSGRDRRALGSFLFLLSGKASLRVQGIVFVACDRLFRFTDNSDVSLTAVGFFQSWLAIVAQNSSSRFQLTG